MKLSEKVKQQIIDILDSKEFMSDLYEGLDEEKRIKLGQFYTPGAICIKMIEKFSWNTLSDKVIEDPTCGSGNLLIACLIAGADSDKLFGNEYDSVAVELCRKRINRACDILGKPRIKDWQIHQGNALHKFALTYFDEDYEEMYFDGKTQSAARKRKLDDPNYDAYTKSEVFKRKYPDLYKAEIDKNLKTKSTKLAEEQGGFDWFNM
jgi:hypothetical protein